MECQDLPLKVAPEDMVEEEVAEQVLLACVPQEWIRWVQEIMDRVCKASMVLLKIACVQWHLY